VSGALRPAASRRLCTLVAVALAASGPVWPAQATATTLPAADLAEFIVNIARYTSWPKAAAPKSLTVCYAHGGAAPATAPISGQDWNVKGVPVTWVPISSPRQVAGCNIVWLNSDVRPAPRAWIAAISDQPVLTLSNYADFTADGGIVGAYRVGSDWRFEINLEALQRSRINIAAVALRLSQKPRAIPAVGEPR
jgi:YfiR/HmsC-like